MSNVNIRTAASQAGLTSAEQEQMENLNKLVSSHKVLLSMPTQYAEQAFAQLPKSQQDAHVAMFGGEDPKVQAKRGWLGSAFHYLGKNTKATLAAPFKALNEVSDFTTRLYRTGAIALDQDVPLFGAGNAFDIANDKGDKIFSPNRITEAKSKFGENYISVAIKVAQGQKLSEIANNGTEEEKLIAANAAQNKDPLFQDALDSVQAAKYSPGRQLANLLLPESMEGSGFLYKGISGVTDAAFRIFSDPTLILGKAKKAYDAGDWLFYNIIGKEQQTYGRSLIGVINNEARVDRVFANPKVSNLFNAYGAELDNLVKARKANDLVAMEVASTQLKRLAPEFGPSAIDEFIKAGVKDATTASNYLKNIQDTTFILRGQAARKTPLIPQLDLARKTRIFALTTGNKVLNIDKVGQDLVRNLYGIGITPETIVSGLGQQATRIGLAEKAVGKIRQDGSIRLGINQIQGKVDRFAQKFAITPYFKDNYFDVNGPDAANQVYRLARLGNTKYHSKIITEAFSAGDENQKRQIFKGIWGTLAETRGWNKSDTGLVQLEQQFARKQRYAPTVLKEEINPATGKSETISYNPAEFDGQELAVLDWQLSSGIAVPSIMNLDSYAAKGALLTRMFGPNYKKWADSITSSWVFFTLAGPRFVIRNSAEDLGAQLAIGGSTWGITKGRFLDTRLNLAKKDGSLGFINRVIRKKDRAAYQAEIADAIKRGDINAVRAVQARAVLEDGIAQKLDKRGAEILNQHIRLGDIDSFSADVSEGSKNALRGASQYLNVTDDVSKYGKVEAFEVDGIRYKQQTGSSFDNFNPVVSQENRVAWLTTIAVNANSDLGSLAIKNLDSNISRETAINNIRKHLDNLPENARNRFDLYTKPGVTTQRHAEAIYDAVRPYFSKRNGELNTDLLSKIRRVDKDGNVVIDSSGLELNHIPGKGQYDLAPEFISGPTLIPVLDSDNFPASILDGGWDIMGAANARISRVPMVNSAVIDIRKTMDDTGFEKSFMDKATAGKTGEALEKSKLNAEKQIIAIAEDLAKNKVLAYVDNPQVRTQFAMSIRNFARFYRATEDFYRRAVRIVRYNPESLARLSLTYEGISHSGFVQTDDNGDQYFFYPGLAPVYSVMSRITDVFGWKDGFKVPAPLEFSGKLKMITPSLNPDSLFPTFAGPLAAVPISFLGSAIPQIKELEGYLLGSYGEDQPLVSAIFPSHINRFLQTLNRDERNSQYASAARKAATYLEATGHGLKPKIDPQTGLEVPPTQGELADFQDKWQSSTMTVLLLRFGFGFFAPASPQITLKSDMAKWVRDNGATNYKQVFNQMLSANNFDMDKTAEEWIKNYPNQMPYTVSESDKNTVAKIAPVESAANWIEQNSEVMKKYPQGASFLIPQSGDFDFNAYKLLLKSGLRSNKTMTDFLSEVQTAKDKNEYFNKRDEYESNLKTAFSDSYRRMLKNEWDVWSTQFKGVRPMLQVELGKGAAGKVEKLRAYEDLRLMLDNIKFTNVQPKTQAVLKSMVEEYESYVSIRDSSFGTFTKTQEYKESLKANVIAKLKELASTNASAQSAYNVLFSSLVRE